MDSGLSNLANDSIHQSDEGAPAPGCIAAVEELAREMEILASGLRSGAGRKSNAAIEQPESFIDVVVVSRLDQCDSTLVEIHPNVPVFATSDVAERINSWKHFRAVITLEDFGKRYHYNLDWRATSILPLPGWVGISLLQGKDDTSKQCSAVMIAFNNQHGNVAEKLAKTNGEANGRSKHHKTLIPDEDEEAAEAIVYTPYGVDSCDRATLPVALPQLRNLAFIHGMPIEGAPTGGLGRLLSSHPHDFKGFKTQSFLHSKYWIGTKEEDKENGSASSSLFGWLFGAKNNWVQDSLDMARKDSRTDTKNGERDKGLCDGLACSEETNRVQLRKGESTILV
jgi:hypothetical protein